MDLKALFQISYGLYILSSRLDGKDAGCIINTLQQVTNLPARLCVMVNKENFTHDVIQKSGQFAAMILLEKTSMDIIRTFGFQSSRDADKFQGLNILRDCAGLPYLAEGVGAHFSCKVIGQMDVGTHTTFLGELVESEVLDSSPVMTYAYYHEVKNGITPPKAPGYQPKTQSSDKAGWKCTRCGYVYEGDPLPEGFVCPICGAPESEFRRIES